MERPPRRHDDEESETVQAPLTRPDWFAQELGKEWETAGDGIYRHAEPAPVRAPAPAEELEDALAPHRRLGKDGVDDNLSTS